MTMSTMTNDNTVSAITVVRFCDLYVVSVLVTLMLSMSACCA